MRLRFPFNSRASGFTLIELVVVLVLMAVLSAMIIPEMRGTLEGELLRSTSRELIRGLSLANSQSITVNQPHRFVIDPERHRYRVEKLARNSEEGSGFVPVRGVPGTEGTFSERITIEFKPTRSAAGEADLSAMRPTENRPEASATEPSATEPSGTAIRFFPDGTAEGAEIQLRDRDGFGLALRLKPVTARVQIIKLERRRGS